MGIKCPKCGSINPDNAPFCRKDGEELKAADFSPFSFSSGATVASISELAEQIDVYWSESIDYLYQGDFASWLDSIGQGDLANKAREIVETEPDRNIGLEKFRSYLGQDASSAPRLKLSHTVINFGRVDIEQISSGKYTLQFEIINGGKGHLYGKVTCSQPWLSLDVPSFSGNRIVVNIKVVGIGYDVHILIQSNGGSAKIPVAIRPTVEIGNVVKGDITSKEIETNGNSDWQVTTQAPWLQVSVTTNRIIFEVNAKKTDIGIHEDEVFFTNNAISPIRQSIPISVRVSIVAVPFMNKLRRAISVTAFSFLVINMSLVVIWCIIFPSREIGKRRDLVEKEPVAPLVHPPKQIPILCYHQFSVSKGTYSISPQLFEAQMKYLADNGYTVIPLQDVISSDAQKLPDKPVVITIDDGYRSVYTTAYPILKKFNYPATLFIYPQYILSASQGALTWQQLKEMTLHGIDVQSHTYSHPNFAKLRWKLNPLDYENLLKTEFSKSKRLIEQYIGKTVDILAYPYGVYDVEMEKLVEASGYKAMVTTNREPNIAGKINRWRLSRYTILQNDTVELFMEKIEAQRLNIDAVTPSDGSTIVSNKPSISANILDEIDAASVKVLKGESEMDFSIVPSGSLITIVVPLQKPLNQTAHIITISAQDKHTHQLKMASWLFTIVPPTYKEHKIDEVARKSSDSSAQKSANTNRYDAITP
jgi:peptidoglycan/xylan/chitin deacetylase (PgdA/CDA1 family)